MCVVTYISIYMYVLDTHTEREAQMYVCYSTFAFRT